MDGYRTRSADTSREGEAILFDAYRRMPPWQKMRMVSELTRSALSLALAGLRARDPEATEEALTLQLAEIRLGRDVVQRVLGRATRPS